MEREAFKGPFVIKEMRAFGDDRLVLDADGKLICEAMSEAEAQWLCDRLNAPAPAAGDWVLVPREPTEAIFDALYNGYRKFGGTAREIWQQVWTAALSAAPIAPPVQAGTEERLAEAMHTEGLTDAFPLETWAWISDNHPKSAAIMREHARRILSSLTAQPKEGSR